MTDRNPAVEGRNSGHAGPSNASEKAHDFPTTSPHVEPASKHQNPGNQQNVGSRGLQDLLAERKRLVEEDGRRADLGCHDGQLLNLAINLARLAGRRWAQAEATASTMMIAADAVRRAQ